MKTFTGTEYLKIDIANQFGLDRLGWEERLWWVEDNKGNFRELAETAKKPILFRKAIRALKQVEAGKPVNHIMGLDATASGIQIMSAMSGCPISAATVNLINTGTREDIYTTVGSEMEQITGLPINRDVMKDPLMTFFYGSEAVPKRVFGEGEALLGFYKAMESKLRGPYELMKLFQSYWNSTYKHFTWTMPDKHTVHIPVMVNEESEIEVDEGDHLRFPYRYAVNQAQDKGLSLAANIVHSVDAWICRKMVLKAASQGFWLAPIHDCFYASPNYMNKVRKNYIDILVELSKMNMVSNILSQIVGYEVSYDKFSYTLHNEICNSEYALS